MRAYICNKLRGRVYLFSQESEVIRCKQQSIYAGMCIPTIRYPDSKASDLAVVFTPDIFNTFWLSSVRSDLCTPEQSLCVSNLS